MSATTEINWEGPFITPESVVIIILFVIGVIIYLSWKIRKTED
ncbi:MAG: hypothetical protein ACFFAU_21095 [Candidatus Hodarchaeota archaeon]